MFANIFTEAQIPPYPVETLLLSCGMALGLGLIIAAVFFIMGECSRHYILSVIVLPVLVQTVMWMVNGNLGTSVAVLGAFSLIRFRSQPGTAREITGIFLAMAVGLATAIGCLAFAFFLTVTVSVVLILFNKIMTRVEAKEKILRITIPEQLDYTSVFDDIFKKYVKKITLEEVKTTNLGSLFELTYRIVMRSAIDEKKMLDEIRCRNGNLNIVCSRELKEIKM